MHILVPVGIGVGVARVLLLLDPCLSFLGGETLVEAQGDKGIDCFLRKESKNICVRGEWEVLFGEGMEEGEKVCATRLL